VDTFLGLPFNIASYALLLHMFAQQTNMVPGTLVGDLTNVHIYDNHMEYVKKQLGRDSNKYSTPTLKLKKAKDIFSYTYEDFEIIDYETYPNWKNVPIAI
jgi:thymidylate synthase